MAEMKIDQATARPIRPGPHEAKPPPARVRRPPAARVAIVQGAYLVAAGLWPILDLGSFMKVTGPKFEGWLPSGASRGTDAGCRRPRSPDHGAWRARAGFNRMNQLFT